MKTLILILSIVCSLSSNAQDSLQSFSYYFVNTNCNSGESIQNFPNSMFGHFNLIAKNEFDLRTNAGDELIFDETGLYISKNKILNISREEIRENSKYTVRNGYLHGILVNDSLAVALEGELYYFLMPTSTYLFDQSNTNQKLHQVDPTTFIVFTKEINGYFSALLLKYENKKITLAELDLTYNEVDAMKYTLTTENQIKTYLLDPTKKDWKVIFPAFVVYDSYVEK
jgi:hypothetical protein